MLRLPGSLTVALALLAAGPAAPAEPGLFCPQCWTWMTDAWSSDYSGHCGACHKPFVELEAETRAWFWCTRRQSWSDAPCADSTARRCCQERRCLAWVDDARFWPGFRSRFCPRCARFAEFEETRPPKSVCAACGGPHVLAEGLARLWYWCETELAWRDLACPKDRLDHCCSPVGSALLTLPSRRRPPTAPVPSARESMLVSTFWLGLALDDPAVVPVHVGFPADAPDASGRTDYLDGHIPGARYLPWGEIAVTRHGMPAELPPLSSLVSAVRRLGIDEGHRVVLYDTGIGIEAARAYLALETAGLGPNLALLDGHWKKWKLDGGPVSRMPPEFAPSAFLPRRLRSGTLPLELVKDLVWLSSQPSSFVILLDARSGDEHRGLRPGRGVARPGHIPGAANVPCAQNVVRADCPVLRDEEELRRLYAGAGVRPGKLIVAYCRTGREACLTYFVLKYLGYEARLYDGSFVEWSAHPELPVEPEEIVR